MKKKYYILAITFLCMLMGQNSYGQWSGGDYETTTYDCDYNPGLCGAIGAILGLELTDFGMDENGHIGFIEFEPTILESGMLGDYMFFYRFR